MGNSDSSADMSGGMMSHMSSPLGDDGSLEDVLDLSHDSSLVEHELMGSEVAA